MFYLVVKHFLDRHTKNRRRDKARHEDTREGQRSRVRSPASRSHPASGPVLGGTAAPCPIPDRIRHRIRLRNESLAITGQRHRVTVRTAEFIRLTGPHNPLQPPEPMNNDFHHRLLMTFPLLGHRPVIDEGQLGIPMAANIGRQIEGPTGSGFRHMPMGVERAVRLAGREI